MLLTSSYTEDNSSPYESWPVDRDQFMYSQYTYPLPILPGAVDSQIIPIKSSPVEYQLQQPGIIGNDVYSDWMLMSGDDVGYLYMNQQMDQNSCFLKQTDEYPLDSSSIYMSDYPATTCDFGYNFENSTVFPLGYNQISQPQFSPYENPYDELYCHKPEQWELDESFNLVAMPGLISSATSVASLSPPWPTSSSTSTTYFEDNNEELLQGLGLYDCPDLAIDEVQDSDPQLSLGKGLKLEESFQLDESCFDEDEEDE